jgi:pyruvate, water dikinase
MRQHERILAVNNFVKLNEVNISHISLVGGKNASTGEMIQHLSRLGISCPHGIAITVSAYQDFLAQNHLNKKINEILASVNVKDIAKLDKLSKRIRQLIMAAPFSCEFEKQLAAAYKKFPNPHVAVRSSSTAEDLANASFAGAQETYLNVRGLKQVLEATKRVFASLYNSRAIAYRYSCGFENQEYAISVGIQPMIRSDKGVSGVLFTLDTESGFDQVILISASYGLGEGIVQGQVNPDEFIVYKENIRQGKPAILQRKLGEKATKMIYGSQSSLGSATKIVAVPKAEQSRFCLNDADIEALAKQALIIEAHYGRPMDIEWAKDGVNGKLYILQARPETVKSQLAKEQMLNHYVLTQKGKILSTGQSIGQRIGIGKAKVILNPKNIHTIKKGDILVADMTDPDWEPIMKIAAGIVTNRGGRTCHAAIIARELGIPAIVGCVDATKKIKPHMPITVSCAEGQSGYVYEGILSYKIKTIPINKMPELPLKICINMGNPDKAFSSQFLPNDGVGLARLEFIIANRIGIHPQAALQFKTLPASLKKAVLLKTAAYANPLEYYIERLREGIATLAAAFSPKEVIFRFSDFKSNEYAALLGGELFEPKEENPMLGFRGASRYKDKRFRNCFELECKALIRVRDLMGLKNAQIMIPFVRTLEELDEIIVIMQEYGLKRGKNGLKVYMMCEIPSNVLLAKEFLQRVDGFSIGTNDLTQLTLGLDRDSHVVASLFDERNRAVKMLLHMAIAECNKQKKYIGVCGQGPSDHLDFAKWLVAEGVHCISLNADTIVETWLALTKK